MSNVSKGYKKINTFVTSIVSIAEYAQPIHQTTKKGANVTITHKLTLALTPDMRRVHEALAELENGAGNPLGLGIVTGDRLVLRITDNFSKLIADRFGVPVDALPIVAPGVPMRIKFEVREIGDPYTNPRTSEEGVIDNNQVAPLDPEVAVSDSLKQSLFQSIMIAKMLTQQRVNPAAAFGVQTPAFAPIVDNDSNDDDEPLDTPAPKPEKATGKRATAKTTQIAGK